jgi:CHAT domain-containing protein
VLHVATHGFFQPNQETTPPDLLRTIGSDHQLLNSLKSEDPMLRSGLVLAGADNPTANPADDGYLTAAEAAGLQLDGTELVVLSACSTGQGDSKTGEGVYGLQRALTVAGARSTLLSLWKVDDAATAVFMTRFYTLLKEGKGRGEALVQVQREFRTDPAYKAKGWDRPYYWAAWQLVGDWKPIQGL